MVEIPYLDGELVTEPVTCPDEHKIAMRWQDRQDYETHVITRGVEVVNTPSWQRDLFFGTGAWYKLSELKLLGNGNLHRGINQVGNAWYRTSWLDLHNIRPLHEDIEALKEI